MYFIVGCITSHRIDSEKSSVLLAIDESDLGSEYASTPICYPLYYRTVTEGNGHSK
ncbi:hypothetical protein ACTXT7_014839, partial [Hymenolepis weldensis]